jgi:hypothetical protein
VWLGFCAVLVYESPKVQDQVVGLPLDVSVKDTGWLTAMVPAGTVKLGAVVAVVEVEESLRPAQPTKLSPTSRWKRTAWDLKRLMTNSW